MKISVSVVLLSGLLVGFRGLQADNPPGQTRVKRVLGVGIFIGCRPVRAFDTVCVFTTRFGPLSYPGPSTPNAVKGIAAAIDDLVHDANRSNARYDRRKKKNRKQKRERIDAIITDDAVTAVAVRWKEKSTINDYDLGYPENNAEPVLFIRNQPTREFETLFEFQLPDKLNFKFTGYKSSAEMFVSLRQKAGSLADSMQVKIDGVITEDGFHGKAIRFK